MNELCYIRSVCVRKGDCYMLTRIKPEHWHQVLVFAGIIFVAINLRPGITAVGPLVGTIRDSMGLDNWSVGLLTGLPLLAFALISPIVPSIGKRLTTEWAVVSGLIILIIGMAVRSIPFVSFLFIGTICIGLGIAICNVLLPGFVKDKYPLKVALMTGVYSTVMGTMAAISSGLSIPFAEGLNLGWRPALYIWAIPAIFGIIIWVYLIHKSKRTTRQEVHYIAKEGNNRIWYSPLAWQVAMFMGVQSSLFYITISWLPEILYFNGLSMTTAGWLLSYTQLIGMPASFIIPVIAGRLESQRILVLVMSILAILGFSGLLFTSSYLLIIISVTFIGVPLGGSFALALTFLGLRARSAQDASELSGMAQSIGYSLAAIGPVLMGYLFDIAGNWTIPVLVLIGLSALNILFGMGAGRNKYVL